MSHVVFAETLEKFIVIIAMLVVLLVVILSVNYAKRHYMNTVCLVLVVLYVELY